MAQTQKRNNDESQGDELRKKDETQGGRVKWTKELTYIFCDLCIQFAEKSKGKSGEVISQKLSWGKIVPEFQREPQLPWDKQKLKNKLDNMKGPYSLWKQLKGRETGLGWDYNKGTIAASEEWWNSKIKDNPKFESFQDEGIEPKHESKLDSIFLCSARGGGVKYTPVADPPLGNIQLDADQVYIPSPPHENISPSINDNESPGGDSFHVRNAWNDVWMDENLTPTPPYTSPFPQSSQNEGDSRRRCKRGLDCEASQSNKSANQVVGG